MNRRNFVSALAAFTLASRAAAAVIPANPGDQLSLDGVWRFKLEQTNNSYEYGYSEGKQLPVQYPASFEPFQQPDYTEAGDWTNLTVPGNWEMAGLSPATYNQPDNASGFYRLWFKVPKSWKGRDVYVNFDGVQNAAEIWLNGEPVSVDEPSWGRTNYHESGWTAFQADLTPRVKFGETNLLALRVMKNSRSADMDSGDYFFLGGIYRPVTQFSTPKTHFSDITVQTTLLSGDRAEVKVLAAVMGSTASGVTMRLGGEPGESSGKIESGRAVLVQIVDHPRLWSAEYPNLYNLTVQLRGPVSWWQKLFSKRAAATETFSKRIGIREVTITNGVFMVNGVPVKLAGICRHDVSAYEGTAVGPDLWRKDISMMKAANINAIRTSHYPYGSGFYDLCDEMGMYVMDELPYCWVNANALNSPAMKPAFEQRARETIRRDKNHPCVLIWTIGNENAAGTNLQVVADLVKQLDSTRPCDVSCFDWDKYDTDLSDAHYPDIKKMQRAVAKSVKTGHPHIYLENPNTFEIRISADPGAWERWGTILQRVWDVCATNDTIPGSFLWEWQDRAIVDPYSIKLFSYFPDTGIQLVKIKGMVDAFRNPRPWLYDVKMIYSPVQIGDDVSKSSSTVSFPVENRYSFTDLKSLKMHWVLERAGVPVASGDSHTSMAPRSAGRVQLDLPGEALAEANTLTVEFVHPNGGSIVAHRFVLAEPPPVSKMNPALPSGIEIPQFNLVTWERPKHSWSKVLRYPAELTNVVLKPVAAAQLSDFKQLDADVIGGKHKKVCGHLHAEFSNGVFSYRLNWTGASNEVQELGWKFEMPSNCDHFSWDRHARWTIYPATSIERADGTATPDSMNASLTRMDRPDAFDFNSTKYDCNWASLTTPAGAGLRVAFSPEQRFHCRGGVSAGDRGFLLFVNQQVSPPDDISKNDIPDYYMSLKRGAIVRGSFRVGSNEMQSQ